MWLTNGYDYRPYEKYAEKGLSEARQQIRFEHKENKRQNKIRAIENYLLSTDHSSKGKQMNMLLEEAELNVAKPASGAWLSLRLWVGG